MFPSCITRPVWTNGCVRLWRCLRHMWSCPLPLVAQISATYTQLWAPSCPQWLHEGIWVAGNTSSRNLERPLWATGINYSFAFGVFFTCGQMKYATMRSHISNCWKVCSACCVLRWQDGCCTVHPRHHRLWRTRCRCIHLYGFTHNWWESGTDNESSDISCGEEETAGVSLLHVQVFWLCMSCFEHFCCQPHVEGNRGRRSIARASILTLYVLLRAFLLPTSCWKCYGHTMMKTLWPA